MNTITFKGINSNTITGLLISELPVITRPARRQETTEVDGLDGDVYRYQGYEVYNKTLVIGLYGDYDIDEIANYFSGEGDLILSNEPTKKYDARAVEAIDFERLIRFRTAKVEFTVQPFKKLVSETAVSGATSPLTVVNAGYVDANPIITVEGTPANVVTLDLDGDDFMTVTIPPEGIIIIDAEALNCYNSNADKNQHVVGDFPSLPSGSHTIGWTGTVTGVSVIPNSRWL